MLRTAIFLWLNIIHSASGRQEHICEGGTGFIDCGSGYHIEVDNSFYGRQNRRFCTSGPLDSTSCYTDVGYQIKYICNGRRTCSTGANNDIFTDPCDGTFKYLEINYECKPVCRISHCPNANLKCTSDTSGTCQVCEDTYLWKLVNGNRACAAKCSHERRWCWPGRCANDLASGCTCQTPEFTTIKNINGDNAKCRLIKKPTIETCQTSVHSKNGEIVQSKFVGTSACKNQQDAFINFVPTSVLSIVEYFFKVDVKSTLKSPRPNFIVEETFGIVGGYVEVVKWDRSGYRNSFITRKDIYADKNSPVPNKSVNYTIPIASLNLRNGEKLCTRFMAQGSGYFLPQDPRNNSCQNKQFYEITETTRNICFLMDTAKPQHCQQQGICSYPPLQVNTRITKNPNITIQFNGWFDPDTEGGIQINSSGIHSYEVAIHSVDGGSGPSDLIVNTSNIYSRSFNGTTTIRTTLPFSGLYAVYLDVVDAAGEGNVKQARRFVLYDDKSKVVLDPQHMINVTSAVIVKKRFWQTGHSIICFNWLNRFFNDLFISDNLLKRIKPEPGTFDGIYEQNDEPLSVHGTNSINGILQFEYTWKVNHGTKEITKWPVKRNVAMNQSACLTDTLQDGYRVNVTVSAKDVLNNTLNDSAAVYIDSSPPDIRNIWLERDGQTKIYIHNSTDLTKMNLTFEVSDPHSGIMELQWSFGQEDSGTYVRKMTGSIGVHRIPENDCANLTFCYCPVEGVCEMYQYAVNMGKVDFEGLHNRPYFFSVYAKNWAGLINVEHIDILIDSSPPEAGTVKEGTIDGPDIDFVDRNNVILNWQGFIDHESGIREYKVAVAPTCLSKNDMVVDNSSSSEIVWHVTTETYASTQIPSVGKFYATVLAYNNALEPSEPSCSDGIVYDQTPIVIDMLRGKLFRVDEGIACINEKPWMVTQDLKRIKLDETKTCLDICNNHKFPEFVSKLEIIPVTRNDSTYSDGLCEILPLFVKRIMFLPVDNVDLQWSFHDEYSQLSDFEIGFGSDITDKNNPDIESYRSTFGRSYYSKVHEGLATQSQFWIFIKSVNKASLVSYLSLGPIVIDETPPVLVGKINHFVSDDYIYVGWSNSTFSDPEHEVPVSQVLFQIRTKAIAVTPFLEHYSSPIHCPIADADTCVKYPVRRLRPQDTESEQLYHVTLHIYNKAGHFTVVKTDSFLLPSRHPPSAGTVIDVNPEHKYETVDVDFHESFKNACVRWNGFSHHKNISFAVGFGTKMNHDNVVKFTMTTDSNFYCTNSNRFVPFVKYFATVRSSCSGGATLVSSNGFMIINRTQVAMNVSLADGKGCNKKAQIDFKTENIDDATLNISVSTGLISGTTYTIVMEQEMRLQQAGMISGLETSVGNMTIKSFIPTKDVYYLLLNCRKRNFCNITSLMKCEWDTDRQISKSEYQFHWVLSHEVSALSPSFQVGFLQINNNKTILVEEFRNIHNTDHHKFTNISLDYQSKYQATLKICFGKFCVGPLYSNGVTIFDLSSPGFTVEAYVDEISNCSALTMFRKMTSNQENESPTQNLFQWTLARSNIGSKIFFPWRVMKDDKLQTCLPETLKGNAIFACVRALVESRPIHTTCTKIKLQTSNQRAVQILDVSKTGRNIDEMMKLRHVSHLGNKMDLLQEYEIDYATSKVTLGGIVMGTDIDSVDFYLMRDTQIPANKQQCLSDLSCVASITSTSGYVFFDHLKPQDGDMFYICCRTNKTYKHREQVTETIGGFEMCSDGVYIDNSRPEPAKIEVHRLINGFITSADFVEITWKDFQEDAPVFNDGLTSAIESYELAIGSYPGTEDILPIIPRGEDTFATLSLLSLKNGGTYYATVKGTNFANLSSLSISDAFTVDITPPTSGTIHIGDVPYNTEFISEASVRIRLKGFDDPESGLSAFWISVVSVDGEVVSQPMDYDTDDIQISGSTTFVDGHSYQIVCRATNRAGLSSTVYSNVFTIDGSYPTQGTVYEGLERKKDIDYQTETTEIRVSWSNFQDAHSGIHHFLIALGTGPMDSDISKYVSVGQNTEHTWKLNFFSGQTYYTTVKACNGAGLCTSATSDGVMVDNSPPIPGIAHVGGSASHKKYLSHNTSLSVKWLGFEDPQSHIEHFEWCIGSSKETCDIFSFTEAALSNAIFKSGLLLPMGVKLYVKVKAFNNAGLLTESVSDSFQIDNTPPTLVTKPFFLSSTETSTSLKNSYQFDNSLLRIGWQFSDPESHVVSTRVSLITHTDGRSPMEDLLLGNENRTTVMLNSTSRLMNGDRYTAVITACNKALLCTTAHSKDLVVDSTPPHLGGFKMPLTWKNVKKGNRSYSVMDVSWHGFTDPETYIFSYHISASTTFSGSELTGGIITVSGNSSNALIPLTAEISNQMEIIITISASNYAGLESKYFKLTVEPVFTNKDSTEGILQIQRHSCKSHFCEGDCTCAVVGKRCNKQNCGAVLDDDVADLKVYVGTDNNKSQEYTASSSCLSAHWKVMNITKQILRFEWSMGLAKKQEGVGIFDRTEYPWNDVGRRKEITYCLPHRSELKHGSSYVVYVRAWLSLSEYSIFQSNPITVDNTPPFIRRKAAVIESSNSPCGPDVAFVNSTTTLCACWKNAFLESESRLTKFEFMMGTSELADDVIETIDVGLKTSICPKTTLSEGTKYFFTVRAFNDVGLHSTLSSDGFVVDDTEPYAGVVFNTDRHTNVLYQSQTNSISASWHGFEDQHSHIKRYEVCVVTINETIVRDFESVGLLSSVNVKGLHLKPGNDYQIGVKAVDAAGYESKLVYSNKIKVDESSPVGFECDTFVPVTENQTAFGENLKFLMSLTENELYYLHLTVPNASLDIKGTCSFDGFSMFLPIKHHQGNITTSDFHFLSPVIGNVTLDVSVENNGGQIMYDAIIYRCVFMKYTNSNNVVQVQQLAAHLLSVKVNIIDPESGIAQVLVGAGTTRHGEQVRPFIPISGGHHGVISLSVPHGTPVYVTAVAKNGAGLQSVYTGNVVVIDHTPPSLKDFTISLTYENNVQNVTNVVIEGSFNAWDDESDLQYCLFGIGTTTGKSDLQYWSRTQTLFSFKSSAFEAHHGMKFYSSLKCVNNVERSRTVSSEPITVSLQDPNVNSAFVEFDETRQVAGFRNQVVQSSKSSLLVHWTGIEDPTGIRRFQCRLEDGENGTVADWQDTGKYDYFMFHNLELKDGQCYTALVNAMNVGGQVSQVVNSTILIESRTPQLTGRQIKVNESMDSFTLDWTGMFEAPSGLHILYEMSLGSRHGYTDIMNQKIMTDTRYTLDVKPSIRSLYVVIRASLETGTFVNFNSVIML